MKKNIIKIVLLVILLVLVIFVGIKLARPKKRTLTSGLFTEGANEEAGTVIDNGTGLMWIKDPLSNPGGSINERVSWQEAKKRCEDLEFAGHKDWRLPTVKELITIIDYSKVNPAINKEIFPNTHSLPYWSSTVYANNDVPAWSVHFGTGLVFDTSKEDIGYIRCVRTVK